MSGHFERTVVIPSSSSGVDCFCLRLREDMKINSIRQRDRFSCELICREVLQNAVEHGNRDIENATISVRVTCDDRKFEAEITDCGPGFDPSSILKHEIIHVRSTNMENNRGLLILSEYATSWEWRDGGRTTFFTYKLGKGSTNMGQINEFTPGCDLVASATDSLKATIKDLIESGSGTFTLDLTGVEMIDSRGLSLLIATANSLGKHDRKLRIIHASPDILDLIRMMRLDRHMQVE